MMEAWRVRKQILTVRADKTSKYDYCNRNLKSAQKCRASLTSFSMAVKESKMEY